MDIDNTIPNGATKLHKKELKIFQKPTEIIDRIIGIVGIAFDVKDLLQELGILPDKQSDEFENVLSAIGDNYAAIQKVGEKIERNFAVMEIVYETVRKTLSIIEATRIEMRQEFKRVLNSLQDLKVEDKISSLATFMDDFRKEINLINSLSSELRVIELNRAGGILDRLNNAVDSGGILHGNLNHIINQRLAVPKDIDDNIAFAALHIMYYGIQYYVSAMFFVLDQYSFLSDYHYNNGDIEKCNLYFDLLHINFKSYKEKLLSFKNQEGLIDKVINVLNEVQSLLFVRNEREDIFKLVQKRIHSLNLVIQKIEDMTLPIDIDKPGKIISKPDFTNSTIATPLVAWVDGAIVSYAIQYQSNNTYSKISDWSDPIVITNKANPTLKIPVDKHRRTRLIFRKFNTGKPHLVGIISDHYQTNFRDINRDVYNAALGSNEENGLNDIKILLENGADSYETYENERRAIHAAAQSGNALIENELLLSKQMNIDIKDRNGLSPIYIAAEAGYDDFIKLLINKGANVNTNTNLKKLSPLHIAAYNGFTSTVQLLGNNNDIDLNAQDNEGFTPLHSAVYGGINVIDFLLSKNETFVNAVSKDGLTPLHLTAIENYDDVIKLLINNKMTDINAKSKGNLTALHFASSLGNLETTLVLIAKNETDINAKSSGKMTPLHFAISLKKYHVAKALLKLPSIEVNSKAKGDITPLHLSSLLNQKDITQALLEKKASVEERTSNNLTALHITAIHNNPEIAQILLEYGADTEAKCNGSTSLHLASFYGSKEAVGVLLKNGANVQVYDHMGFTPLHVAVNEGKTDVVKTIIDFNATFVNIKTLDGPKRSSPLHLAAQKGYLDIMKYLIDEKNADFEILNKYLDNPLHYACKYGHFDVVQYLIEKKNCVTNSTNSYHETPLHLAARSGNIDVVQYLIDLKKLDFNKFTIHSDSILHYAASSGNLMLVKYLVNEKGISIDILNHDRYSPLAYAVWFNQKEVYTYLLENSSTNGILLAATLSGNLELVKYISNLNTTSFYPLNIALRYGYADIARYFVDEKHVHISNTLGLTALHLAALSGNVNLMKYFVEEKRMNVNVYFTLYGITPLCFAALSGNLESVEYLIQNGARANVPYDYLAAPLSFSVASGNLELVKYFVEVLKVPLRDKYSLPPTRAVITTHDFGIYNSMQDYIEFDYNKLAPVSRKSPTFRLLATALGKGYLNIVKYFMEEIKHINLQDALFIASEYDRFDIIKYLVEEKKLNVNIKDDEGNTPAYKIVQDRYSNLDIIQYLIDDCNGDIYNRNRYGETLLHEASKWNRMNVAKYLINNKKFDINIGDNNRNSALHIATKYQSFEVANYLIMSGANVDEKNEFGETPLHIAASKSFMDENELLDIVKRLVECGADVNAENNDGETPLDYLGASGSKIKDYLISKGAHHGHRIIRSINSNNQSENMIQTNTPWVNNLIQNTTNALTNLSQCLKLAFNSKINTPMPNVDVNGTIFLLDVFVRKITGQQYIPTLETNLSFQEAKACAANIVMEFEAAVKAAAELIGISSENLNVDFFDLYLNVNKKLIRGKFSEIPVVLYSCLNHAGFDDKLHDIFKCKIDEMFDYKSRMNRKEYINCNIIKPVINQNTKLYNDRSLGFVKNKLLIT